MINRPCVLGTFVLSCNQSYDYIVNVMESSLCNLPSLIRKNSAHGFSAPNMAKAYIASVTCEFRVIFSSIIVPNFNW